MTGIGGSMARNGRAVQAQQKRFAAAFESNVRQRTELQQCDWRRPAFVKLDSLAKEPYLAARVVDHQAVASEVSVPQVAVNTGWNFWLFPNRSGNLDGVATGEAHHPCSVAVNGRRTRPSRPQSQRGGATEIQDQCSVESINLDLDHGQLFLQLEMNDRFWVSCVCTRSYHKQYGTNNGK
jgi:hypothetical protein